MHTYIHTYVHTYTIYDIYAIYTHLCTYGCINVYTYIYTYTHKDMCMYTHLNVKIRMKSDRPADSDRRVRKHKDCLQSPVSDSAAGAFT